MRNGFAVYPHGQYGVGVNGPIELVARILGQYHQTVYLGTAAGRARTGSEEHEQQKYRGEEGPPGYVIAYGISRAGDDGYYLGERYPHGLFERTVLPRHIEPGHHYGRSSHGDDGIPLGLFVGEEPLHVAGDGPVYQGEVDTGHKGSHERIVRQPRTQRLGIHILDLRKGAQVVTPQIDAHAADRREVQAPDGYVLDTGWHGVTTGSSASGDLTIEKDVENDRLANLMIEKTTDFAGTSAGLPGVTFTLCDAEGKPVEKKKQLGDVMPLDEALKQLLHPEKSGAGKDQEEEEPDISDLEEAIEEIEAVADLEMADKAVQKVKKNKPASVSGKMTEIVPEDDEEETEDKDESLENTENETVVIEEEKVLADDDQIKGQMSFEDILAGWEQQVQASAAETAEEEIQPDQDIEALIEEAEELITMPEDADLSVDEAEELSGEDGEILEDEAEELPEEEGEILEDEAEELPEEDDEILEDEAEELPEEDDEILEDEAEELPEEDSEILEDEAEELPEEDSEIPEDEAEEFLEEESKIPEGGEIEEEETMDIEEKKKPEPILPPDIQRLIDEIEGVAPVEEPKVKKEKKPEEPHENMGKVTEELRIDDLDEFLDEEEYFDDDEITDDAEEYFDAEDEEAADEEEYFDGPDLLDEDEEYFEGRIPCRSQA